MWPSRVTLECFGEEQQDTWFTVCFRWAHPCMSRLPLLSRRMASMMSNRSTSLSPPTSMSKNQNNNISLDHISAAASYAAWTVSDAICLFLVPLTTCFHLLGALWRPEAAVHQTTTPQTHCKPSVKHQDEWQSWTRATCKAAHSWARLRSARSVLPYPSSARVGFTATYTRVHLKMSIRFRYHNSNCARDFPAMSPASNANHVKSNVDSRQTPCSSYPTP